MTSYNLLRESTTHETATYNNNQSLKVNLRRTAETLIGLGPATMDGPQD